MNAEQIKAVVEAVNPKPVNILVSSPGGLTLEGAASLGVRRISVGGAMARAAWGGFMASAQLLAQQNSFEGFAGIPSHQDLDDLFSGA